MQSTQMYLLHFLQMDLYSHQLHISMCQWSQQLVLCIHQHILHSVTLILIWEILGPCNLIIIHMIPSTSQHFANLISTCQPQSFLINTNSTHYLQSTFTNTASSTPYLQSTFTCTTSTKEAAAQPTANQNSSLIDLAEAALES